MPIEGLKKARDDMRKRKRLFSGQNPKMYNKIGEQIASSIKKNIDDGGRNPKWQSRTRPYTWPILNKTSRMKNRAESTAREWIHTAGMHINRIFSPLYGIYHQYGTSKMPIRKYIKLIPSEIERVKNTVRKAFLTP